MNFASIPFICYFLPIAVLGYFVFSFSRTIQNVYLLVCSVAFYALGEPSFAFITIVSVLVNYILGLVIQKLKRQFTKRIITIFGCIINLAVLAIFKYYTTVANVLKNLFSLEFDVYKLVVPIGLSFVTFRAVSYLVDIYRNKISAEKNILNLGLYISFFPQIIGPFMSYDEMKPQIINRNQSLDTITASISRLAQGIIKKVLIANNIRILTDTVFSLSNIESAYNQMAVLTSWVGAIAFILGLYYDILSYTDMAIGLGGIFGFKLDENFERPFFATSLTDFISRWHITLNRWFKEYIYYSLGGSRVVNQDIMVRNLAILWIVFGVWHELDITFICFGLVIFILLLAEKILQINKSKSFSAGKRVYTILAVLMLGVLFKSENTWQLSRMFMNMFGLTGNSFVNLALFEYIKEYSLVLVVAIISLFPIRKILKSHLNDKHYALFERIYSSIYVIAISVLTVISILGLVNNGGTPFIYFEF